MFNVGIIGATGFIGTPYREEIREVPESARIVALCARRLDRLEDAARTDGCDFITQDWREVVHHPKVDLVVIVTPDRLHREPALAAAAARKHLFCDKPIGADVTEAYEIWSAYQNSGLGHYVPYWTRYEPKFRRVKELIESGTLGEIKVAIYRWHNNRPISMPFTWRDDANLSAAGSIGDVGSHAYDTMRWLINSEASRIFSHASIISPPKPDLGAIDLEEALEWSEKHSINTAQHTRSPTACDYGAITWEFQNGVLGILLLSHAPVLRKGLAPELEIHGSEASVSIDRVRDTVSLTRVDGNIEWIEEIPDVKINRWDKYVFPALNEHATGQENNNPGLRDGWRTQIFTESAVKSSTRGTWVELAEVDQEATDR